MCADPYPSKNICQNILVLTADCLRSVTCIVVPRRLPPLDRAFGIQDGHTSNSVHVTSDGLRTISTQSLRGSMTKPCATRVIEPGRTKDIVGLYPHE